MAGLAGLLLVLALAGCAYPSQSGDSPGADPRTATETRAPAESARTESVPYAYRPGYGIVESVTRLESGGAAAAGGTAGRFVDRVAYRLTIRMDDGTLQTVLQDSPGFAAGDRVRLTEDGNVIRL